MTAKASYLSLQELQQRIKSAIEDSLPLPVWVVAEISDLKVNSYSGHCYMELVEKAEAVRGGTSTPKAQARAVIWRNQYAMLSAYFLSQTGSRLQVGMKILAKVMVTYHELYGLSLQISDIDPTYTLGEVERQKQITISQLKADGVWDMNRELSLPTPIQRIAIISSATAAGYQDFCREIADGGYDFRLTLFEAVVQGERAEDSVIDALGRIAEREEEFDVVVLIRGGGSTSDLSCFNSYRLCAYVAQFPLPVLTGIGHLKDESVADMVAHTPLKTPTAVAAWLTQQMQSLEGCCIIFIDEIDAVGRSRDNRYGSNSEQEQTLNQLLSEIDGFEPSKGIVCLAATNRPEILDKALLRPGRFDRRIVVDRPNLQGRLDTLKVHTRKIKLAEDVDLRKIAQATAGAVGADLANLVNEAALRAVRQGRKAVNQEDLMVSFETVIAGSEKKNTVLTDTEKRLVAYHEVGHALVAALDKRSVPVSKITIVPHTEGSLGYTLYLPEEEKFLSSREELLVDLRSVLGGRAAEDVVFHTMTTGAANDLQKATATARNMVALYGMSEELGLMAPASVSSQYLDGQSYLDCSQETSAQVDAAVKRILNTCYADACRILTENRALLDEISEFLLVKETITGEEMMAFVRTAQEPKELPQAEETEE